MCVGLPKLRYCAIFLFIFSCLWLAAAETALAQPLNASVFTREDCAIPDLGLELKSVSPGGNILTRFDSITCGWWADSDHEIRMEVRFFWDEPSLLKDVSNPTGSSYYFTVGPTPEPKYEIIQSKRKTGDETYVANVMRNTQYKDMVSGYRAFYSGKKLVIISCTLAGYSDSQTITMLDKVEAKARELDLKPKPKLTVTYYDLFNSEALKDGKQVGGDVVFTLGYGDGMPLMGHDIYIFLSNSKDDPNNRVIDLPYEDPDFILYSNDGVPWTYSYAKVTTDVNGQATWNYVHSGSLIESVMTYGCVNYGALGDALKRDGHVSYNLTAIAFDRDPLKDVSVDNRAKVISKAFARLEIRGVAAITKIEGVPYISWPTPGATPVSMSGEAKVRVRNDQGSKGVYPADAPYYLMPGDKVLFAPGNYAEITFITGEKFHVTANERTLMDQYSDDTMAYVQIGNKDLGWYRWLSSRKFHVFELTFTGTHTVIEGLHGGLSAVGIGLLNHLFAYVFFTASFQGSQSLFDPLMVSSESIILLSPDNDSVTVYTFEGKAHLHDSNGDTTIDVPAGHKVKVSGDKGAGHNSFSSVMAFSESEVNSSDRELVQLARSRASSPAPSAAPSTSQSSPGSSPGMGILAVTVAMIAALCLFRYRRGSK